VERDAVMGNLVRHGLVPAVLAAKQCGLLDALDEQPATAEALAARCHVVPRAAALVLDALAAIGICERVEAGYRRDLGPDARWPWSGLPRLLADGGVQSPIDDRARRGQAYAGVVDVLAERFGAPAAFLARRLGPAGSILDVGCGSGVWTLAMLAESPRGRLVGLDLAEVLPRFLARAAAAGLGDRVEGVVSDYGVEPPALRGRRFDRVVLANVLHLEDEAEAERLLARWAAAVAPAGSLIVLDCIPDGSARGEVERAFYALHLGLRTARGRVHELAALARWSEAAGLSGHEVLRDDRWPAIGAFVARRDPAPPR